LPEVGIKRRERVVRSVRRLIPIWGGMEEYAVLCKNVEPTKDPLPGVKLRRVTGGSLSCGGPTYRRRKEVRTYIQTSNILVERGGGSEWFGIRKGFREKNGGPRQGRHSLGEDLFQLWGGGEKKGNCPQIDGSRIFFLRRVFPGGRTEGCR